MKKGIRVRSHGFLLIFVVLLLASFAFIRRASAETNRVKVGNTTPFLAQVNAANVTFKTYVIPNKFSIQHPISWSIENRAEAVPQTLLIISSRKLYAGEGWPNDFIKADVQTVPGSFDAIVRQQTENRRGVSKILKKGRTKVGGRDAFRIWSFGGHDYETYGIVTYIRYTNSETAMIASYYVETNPTVISVVQHIHGSFRSSR